MKGLAEPAHRGSDAAYPKQGVKMKNLPRERDGAIDRAIAQAASRHLRLVKPTNPPASSDEQGPNSDDPVLTVILW